MQVALVLSSLGMPSVLLEKSALLGGRVPKLSRTFPFFNDDGFNDGKQFTDVLERDLQATPLADIRLGTVITALRGDFPNFTVELSDGRSIAAGAVVVATGFTPFDPTSLKEYGYGIYPNVITATELEWMLNPRGPTGGKLVRRTDGKPAERLAIVFCVGSRNRRIGLALGRGTALAQAIADLGHVAEGVWSAPAIVARAGALHIEMPISEAVCAVLEGRTSAREAVERLLSRDPRAERS